MNKKTEILPEAFRAQPDKFDMVITDRNMPNMSGAELASVLVKIRPDIPIIICTGFSEKRSQERAYVLAIKGLLAYRLGRPWKFKKNEVDRWLKKDLVNKLK